MATDLQQEVAQVFACSWRLYLVWVGSSAKRAEMKRTSLRPTKRMCANRWLLGHYRLLKVMDLFCNLLVPTAAVSHRLSASTVSSVTRCEIMELRLRCDRGFGQNVSPKRRFLPTNGAAWYLRQATSSVGWEPQVPNVDLRYGTFKTEEKLWLVPVFFSVQAYFMEKFC